VRGVPEGEGGRRGAPGSARPGASEARRRPGAPTCRGAWGAVSGSRFPARSRRGGRRGKGRLAASTAAAVATAARCAAGQAPSSRRPGRRPSVLLARHAAWRPRGAARDAQVRPGRWGEAPAAPAGRGRGRERELRAPPARPRGLCLRGNFGLVAACKAGRGGQGRRRARPPRAQGSPGERLNLGPLEGPGSATRAAQRPRLVWARPRQGWHGRRAGNQNLCTTEARRQPRPSSEVRPAGCRKRARLGAGTANRPRVEGSAAAPMSPRALPAPPRVGSCADSVCRAEPARAPHATRGRLANGRAAHSQSGHIHAPSGTQHRPTHSMWQACGQLSHISSSPPSLHSRSPGDTGV
jgi:hypothetical protein